MMMMTSPTEGIEGGSTKQDSDRWRAGTACHHGNSRHGDDNVAFEP